MNESNNFNENLEVIFPKMFKIIEIISIDLLKVINLLVKYYYIVFIKVLKLIFLIILLKVKNSMIQLKV